MAIVVLTYLDGAPAVELVAALVGDGVPPAAISVVQNAASAALELPAGVELLTPPGNPGYAGGMNAGIGAALAAGATSVLLLTHDARPRPGCVAALTAALEAHHAYGILAPVLRSDDARLPFSAGGHLDRFGAPAHNLDLDGVADGVKPVDWVDGSVMLVRAEVFARVGLLDERFFMYCDDVEISLRAREAGWRVGVVEAAQAHQATGVSRRPGAFAYLNTRNGLEVARLAGGAPAVAGNLGRLGRACWDLGRRSFAPNVPAGEKAAARVRLRATVAGIGHFAIRRWGAPPAGHPGLGDDSVGDAEAGR
ncbi:MAG: hypothetical protein QOE92_121 [Chloroflexota bacterium]|nr:hypothetical protein [Chloroflexota bacterium]